MEDNKVQNNNEEISLSKVSVNKEINTNKNREPKYHQQKEMIIKRNFSNEFSLHEYTVNKLLSLINRDEKNRDTNL